MIRALSGPPRGFNLVFKRSDYCRSRNESLNVPVPRCTSQSPPTKAPASEPIPGYRLIEPLGRGGFGEVWKCEAPGGLLKAIKFVSGGEDQAKDGGAQLRQEYDAFQQVKSIRHPFLLSLERVELVGNELIMVMELADRQLGDRFTECR